MSHLDDSEVLLDRLTEEIFADTLKNIQDANPMAIVSNQFYASVEDNLGHNFFFYIITTVVCVFFFDTPEF